MSKRNLLAILGSPRKNGNAAKMLYCATETAKNNGWHVDIVYLYDKKMEWCRGCMACKKSGICVIDDDLAEIRDLFQKCDAVILSAPTYFANVPAIVKNMFDRLMAAVYNDNESIIPKPKLSHNQKYLLFTTCSTPFPFSILCGQSRGTLRAMDEFFHISGMKKMGTVTVANTRNMKNLPKAAVNKIRGYWR